MISSISVKASTALLRLIYVSTIWSVHILCIVSVRVLFFVRQRHIKLIPSSFCIEDQAVIGDVVSPSRCIWTVGMIYSL